MLQRSRYEFLSMLLEVETRKHRDSHHLLGAVRTLLESDANLVDRRHVSLQIFHNVLVLYFIFSQILLNG